MAVEVSNVEQVMEWLAEGSEVRSSNATAEALVTRLAELAFQGELDWPNRTDRAEVYRDGLRDWFAGDSGSEYHFVELTAPDADAGVFVEWFARVVDAWESRAAQDAPGGTDEDDEAVGLPDPNYDGTAGTEYYRVEESTGRYLFAADAHGPDWATYEQRRYTDPVRDDNYGLDYRYDRKDEVYEWYDARSDTWKGQAWADRFAAQGGSDPDDADDGAEAFWDENWQMFYRLGPAGAYEYADARTPGEESSGCGEVWLTHEQALARRAGTEPDVAEQIDSLRNDLLGAAGSVFREMPQLEHVLSDEDIKAVFEQVAEQLIHDVA